MATTTSVSTQRFKNMCFIGLNRAELFPEDGGSLVAENWRELIDERYRNRHLMMAFITPRDVDGEPMDPLTAFIDDRSTPDEAAAIRESLKNISLFDLARIKTSGPNRLNILAVADVLFYWDINGAYVNPTTPQNWQNDLKELTRFYPRTTEKHLYTNWETQGLEESSFSLHKIRELPLDSGMWVNMPTFHETYGTPFLIAGIAASVMVYGTLTLQENNIQDLRQREQQMRTDSERLTTLKAATQEINAQEADLRYRGFISTITKDVALATSDAKMQLENMQLEIVNQNDADNRAVLVTLQAPNSAYIDFAQQEPVARDVLKHSATLEALRKRPSDNGGFVLEGIVPLSRMADRVRKYQDAQKIQKEPTP